MSLEPTPTPVSYHHQWLETDSWRLHYLQAGSSGEVLLLLHGTALDSAELSYGAVMQALSTHYRVYALDWPGYGASLWQGEPCDSVEVLALFIRELALEPLNIMAFSMGGAVALRYALQHPGQVQRLLLLNSYGLRKLLHVPLLPRLALELPGVSAWLWQALQRYPRLLQVCLQLLVLGRGVPGEMPVCNPLLLEQLQQALAKPQAYTTFIAWLKQEIGWWQLRSDLSADLSKLPCPLLLLHGQQDIIIPAAHSRYAAKQLQQAGLEPRLHCLPGCGHWLPREAPQWLVARVLEFLQPDTSDLG